MVQQAMQQAQQVIASQMQAPVTQMAADGPAASSPAYRVFSDARAEVSTESGDGASVVVTQLEMQRLHSERARLQGSRGVRGMRKRTSHSGNVTT